jgi:glycosyltransferase involved in cell wall biosynthesis
MTRVLLLHSGYIPHYRVPIYGRLSRYLERYGFELTVASDRIQADNPHPVNFPFEEMRLSVWSIARLIHRKQIDVILLFVDMRHRYLFPTYCIAKGLLRRKMIYWGQGLNLANPKAVKNLAYRVEHLLCDSIILYAEHLKKYVAPRFHRKTFIANNTLDLNYPGLPAEKRVEVLSEYGIRTRKNIICVGRLQKRKRLPDLVAAHARMNRPDIGLILVGPDTDGILKGLQGDNVYKLGPLYGVKKFDLLSAADVFCLPGAVGLSIVDAFHCGLPLVTEEGDESAEMMYLRNGQNGFIVPRGDILALSEKLLMLLDNEELLERFSAEARREIAENGNVDKLCAGFRDALFFATGRNPLQQPELRSESSAATTSR